jgi:hypothetical protein
MFTLTNLSDGDLALGPLGTIRRNGTLAVSYISPDVRKAKEAALLSISPAVTTVPAVSALTNPLASYVAGSIVEPSTQALARANDVTLAAAVIGLRNDLESLRAYVEANVKPGTN